MEQVIFWIATALSFVGNLVFTLSALFNKKRVVVSMQTSNHVLSTVAQLLQKAYSGMAQDAVCFFKNIILLFVPDGRRRLKTVISVICIVCGVALGVALNVVLSGGVWYGYMPVVGTAFLSTTVVLCYVVDFTPLKQLLIMKGGLMFNAVVWATYGIFVKLYPITIFNCLTFVLSVAAIVRFFVVKGRGAAVEEVEVEEEDTKL